MKFRKLETRIVVFFVALLVAVQVTVFVLVSAANQRIARDEVAYQIGVGEKVFKLVVEQNGKQLSQAAAVLAADFGFRQAIGTNDKATIASVLENHGTRINASIAMLVGLDEKVVVDTRHPELAGKAFPFAGLISGVRERGQTSAVVLIDKQLYQLVVVPVLTPLPAAWVAMGFAIDDSLAKNMSALTSLQVSFLAGSVSSGWHIGVSTLPAALRGELTGGLAAILKAGDIDFSLQMRDTHHEIRVLELARQGDLQIVAVLQKSLETALEPFNQLSRTLLFLGIASILVSLLGSLLVGRSLARPINRLAQSARRMRDGDYSQKIDIRQDDEIGELASSFNHMREAISVREEKILKLAYQDSLTSLPNRALFNDRLETALKAAERTKTPVTILMMDLDRFKYVNDALGHPVGDMVLREIGARLQALLRKSDTVARLGGDEFAIILLEAGIVPAQEIAATIQRALEKPILLEGQPLDVGSSIGIASYPEHGTDSRTLMSHADMAMYVAKRSNRGFVVYSDDFYQPREDLLRLLGDLRLAIERDEFVLYYQPKINLQTGQVRHVEALIRWIHPQRGFISPADFIPFAEHTGFIRSITRRVVEMAIRQSKTWRDMGLDITVSLNISSRDLVNPELPNLVEKELADNGLEARCIAIEVTESGFMEDPALALDILTRLDKLGVRLSIDDYGTGYSSLSYIKRLPVQELKIDQSFVKNMVLDKSDAVIVKSTIDLGHNMGFTVVAEGVEDQASLALLKELGCDHAQGYFMSKPLSVQNFEEWLTLRESSGKLAIAREQHE
ncbi:MAG: putative bifunctional diguanylate cyclase/phosphodiesterase [Betaproteobacteria bacterium]